MRRMFSRPEPQTSSVRTAPIEPANAGEGRRNNNVSSSPGAANVLIAAPTLSFKRTQAGAYRAGVVFFTAPV